MWISCDSQEHHWISTTTTPMWDQLGRPRIQKQPATVTTYQDEPENHIKSCRCQGPIVSSPHLGMVGRFCVSFPSSRGSRVDGKCDTRWYKIFGGCVVCVCEVHQWFFALTIQHSGKMMFWGYCGSFAFICSLNELPNSRMTPRGVRGSTHLSLWTAIRGKRRRNWMAWNHVRRHGWINLFHAKITWDHLNPWQVVASKALEKDIRHPKNTYSVYIHIGVQMKCSGRSNSPRKKHGNDLIIIMICYVVMLAKNMDFMIWQLFEYSKLFRNQSWYEISGWSQESRRLMCLG